MNNKEINLEIITKQYRKKGAALKGYKTIHFLIQQNNLKSLEILLRFHKDVPIVSPIEIQERDNIDFLIDYYSILELALIAGYIPNQLPKKVKMEIEYILKNEFVEKYFTKFYPLLLPQLLIKQINISLEEEKIINENTQDSEILFDRFLFLNHLIKKDSDIDQFLWFLDDGWTSGYSIYDFWEILKNDKITNNEFTRNKKHPLTRALWGFIKYIQFLNDFADLIRDCKSNLLLQSAFWHYQSYWFENIQEKIGDIITLGIHNIRNSLLSVNSVEIISNKNSFLNSEQDILTWQEQSNQFSKIEEDIKFLLNNKLGRKLKDFYLTLNPDDN